MANAEWEKLKEALKKPASPEAVKEAAEAFRKHLEAKKAEGKGSSKPTLVNLSSKAKDYPNAVPLESIPKIMQEKPGEICFLIKFRDKSGKMDISEMIGQVQKIVGDRMRIRYQLVDKIEKTIIGKRKTVLQALDISKYISIGS